MKCPTCRRQAGPDDSNCSRCGTSLALLFQLQGEYEQSVQQGMLALRHRDLDRAEKLFSRAQQIQTSKLPLKGLALSALLKKNFPEVLQIYSQLKNSL